MLFSSLAIGYENKFRSCWHISPHTDVRPSIDTFSTDFFPPFIAPRQKEKKIQTKLFYPASASATAKASHFKKTPPSFELSQAVVKVCGRREAKKCV